MKEPDEINKLERVYPLGLTITIYFVQQYRVILFQYVK